MTTDPKTSVRRVALGDLSRELDVTRPVLERIPDDRLDWRPHEKSFSVGELGAHVAHVLTWARDAVLEDGFDMAESSGRGEAPGSAEEILETFDSLRSEAEDALAGADDATLLDPWTLRNGEQEIFTLPKAAVVRTWALSHLIHHRGQLTVYLRLLDIPVPPTYGPTADEDVEM